jgi:hypothetical protein
MPDQVESRPRQPPNFWRLAFEFLHIVLAKFPQPELIRFPDRGCRKHLSYRQQLDLTGIAARLLGSALDALADVGEAFRQAWKSWLQASVCHEGKARTPTGAWGCEV